MHNNVQRDCINFASCTIRGNSTCLQFTVNRIIAMHTTQCRHNPTCGVVGQACKAVFHRKNSEKKTTSTTGHIKQLIHSHSTTWINHQAILISVNVYAYLYHVELGFRLPSLRSESLYRSVGLHLPKRTIQHVCVCHRQNSSSS